MHVLVLSMHAQAHSCSRTCTTPQVTLARAKQYLEAERLKKKADVLEAIEIDNIRRTAKQENQLRFKALLKKQQWDRQALAEKLQVEKKCLLEAKAQDFTRLKKRLRNAEAELKKTHIRQSLQAQRKLIPHVSSGNLNRDRSSTSRSELGGTKVSWAGGLLRCGMLWCLPLFSCLDHSG